MTDQEQFEEIFYNVYYKTGQCRITGMDEKKQIFFTAPASTTIFIVLVRAVY